MPPKKKNSTLLAPCGSCFENVTEKGVACDGFCKAWHHFDCLDLSSDVRKRVLESKIKWYCPECTRLEKTLSSLLKKN